MCDGYSFAFIVNNESVGFIVESTLNITFIWQARTVSDVDASHIHELPLVFQEFSWIVDLCHMNAAQCKRKVSTRGLTIFLP